jgi:hypothetical protein
MLILERDNRTLTRPHKGAAGMTIDEARAFAAEWIAAWNSHDLDRVLSHYAANIVFLSPFAQQLVGNGRVSGLPALRAYAITFA